MSGGGGYGQRRKTPHDKKCPPWPHVRSVVTFGIAEQGREEREGEEG